MNDERAGVGERLMAAAASTDWITPVYSIVRGAFGDGITATIYADTWTAIKPTLESYGVNAYGERLEIDSAGRRWMVVSFPRGRVEMVNALLRMDGHQEIVAPAGWFRWWKFALMVAVSVCLALAVGGLVMMVGQ